MSRIKNKISVFISICGAFFCFLSFWGLGDVFCLTSGCAIYKGYTVFGLSLYLIGAFFFLFLAICAFLGREAWLRWGIVLALTGNLFFLSVQIFFWPCTSCLVVAAMLGGVGGVVFERKFAVGRWLLLAWTVLFCSAMLGSIRDMVSPWSLQERIHPEMEIFFSPSCLSCRVLVEECLAQEARFQRTLLYPVAKSTRDRERIFFLKKMLDEGVPEREAFSRFWAGTPTEEGAFWEEAGVLFGTLRNSLVLARMGKGHVPLVLSRRFWEGREGAGPEKDGPSTGCAVMPGGRGVCEDAGSGGDPFRRGW